MAYPMKQTARCAPGTLRAQQELLQQRRNMEEQRHSMWTKHFSDLKKTESNAETYQKLSSDRTFKASIDCYMKQQIEDRKTADMQLRRAELCSLLHDEENQYQIELLDRLKDAKSQRVREMQERVETLRQARIRQQEQVVSEKLQDVWRRNCPELREITSKQIELETAKAWGDQINIRRQNEEEERQVDHQLKENMKRELQLATAKDEQKSQDEKMRMRTITGVWQEQIESLKKHDDEMKVLQQQERMCMQQIDELGQLEDQRKQMDELEKRKELGRTLMNQHAAHIRRRNRQVQESLEFDRQLLDSVNKLEEEAVLNRQHQRDYARTIASQMKESMENRLRIEKEREKEIDRLDREDAKAYWERREQEWRAEEDARRGLVQEVIGDLRQQLRDKVAANRCMQQEVDKGKQEVASMMKLSEMEKQRELDSVTCAQMTRRDDLDTQLRELEHKEIKEREEALNERRKNQTEQKSYDDFLARETTKLGLGSQRARGAASWQ